MSAFYERMAATATRLVNRFDQEGTRLVIRVPTYAQATMVAGNMPGIGATGYSDGTFFPASGSMDGSVLGASQTMLVGSFSASEVGVYYSGDVVADVDGLDLIISGQPSSFSSAAYYADQGITYALYGPADVVVGQSYALRLGVDPKLPPKTTVTYTDVPAVARGVEANIQTADPNLAATDIQVIVDTAVYSPAVGDVVEINGADRAVVRVDAIPAAGDPVAYRFFVR